MFYLVRFPVKKSSLCVALAALVLAGSGCAFMSDEDRDFYGKGWVHPSDLDKQPVSRQHIPDPSHPEQNQSADAPARTASSDQAPEWLIPEQAPH